MRASAYTTLYTWYWTHHFALQHALEALAWPSHRCFLGKVRMHKIARSYKPLSLVKTLYIL